MSARGGSRDRMRRLLGRLGRSTEPPTAGAEPRVVPDPGRVAEAVVGGRSRPFFADATGWATAPTAEGTVHDPRGLDNPPLPDFEQSEDGGLIVRTTRFAADFRHGGWTLGEVRRRETSGLDLLAAPESPGTFDWHRAAFLDTETTGLSSGSGVLVFLTAVGRFEGADFVVRQYLCRNPDAEPAKMAALGADLAQQERVVSFFGKAFDRHRLLDRARYLGTTLPFPEDHFDLYWLSRRVVGGRYPDLKLRRLEHELLQYYRLHDLPGSEAPEAWFRSLRGEGEEALEGVILHNLIDVVSLASLAAELCLRIEAPPTREDRLARARVLARADRRDEALAELRGVVDIDSPPELHFELAELCRGLGRHEDQRAALEQTLQRSPAHRGAHLALAKWWEHRGRQAERALQHTEQALEGACGRERRDLEHRRRRLLRRLGNGGSVDAD